MCSHKYFSPQRARKFSPSTYYRVLVVLLGAYRATYDTRILQQATPNQLKIAMPRTTTYEHKADRHQESRIYCRPARISCGRQVRENIDGIHRAGRQTGTTGRRRHALSTPR